MKKVKKVFMVGIGGISMSALAILLKKSGCNVIGSDRVKTRLTKKLKDYDIKVFYSSRAHYLKGVSLVVFSGAISKDHPQLVYAKQKGIKAIERSVLLAEISKRYSTVIAVSGTHGKTTTTAMLGYIFLLAGLNPTVHVGAECECFNGNLYYGNNNFFITEACEFRDSFLTLNPNYSIITNIEREHLDYFKNFDKEIKSFEQFADNTKEQVFVNYKYKDYVFDSPKITFFNGHDICANNIVLGEDGKYSFDCYINKKLYSTIKLNLFGKFNIENALAVIGVCNALAVDKNAVITGFATFSGVKRRFEILLKNDRNILIHDYAHHPTEISNVIKTAKQIYGKKVVCVFQPHTYSRTKYLIKQFEHCFDDADILYLLNNYSAREKYDLLGSSQNLLSRLKINNTNTFYPGVFGKRNILKRLLKDYESFKDCVIFFLGAGDIEIVARNFVKKIKKLAT